VTRPALLSVVIPAYNAENTIGAVLEALVQQVPVPDEIIVVDDCSTDGTAAVAQSFGARVVRTERSGYAGGARNRGWEVACGDVIVFLDSDAVPAPGWCAALGRAIEEFPGAIVGCARTFSAETPWGWVAHFQVETPYLPSGAPRTVPFVSSFCMAVPHDASIRWDESYGGEDAVFCADAYTANVALVFDPRFSAEHAHERRTFRDLRSQQRRLAYGLARAGTVQREGLHKRVFSRIPVHYFLLARLPLIDRRLRSYPGLRARFLRLLPRMIVAEWTLGLSAFRYALSRPSVRGQEGEGFR
jgi:glycosyltransferase involved in cell wall biosynthesis